MIDWGFGNWQPGEMIKFGLPWHGLVRRESTDYVAPWIMTLPNGRTLPVRGPTTNVLHSNGASIAYRDPRAADVEPSEQDLSAGATWPGTALLPNYMLDVDEAYFDGEKTWRIIWRDLESLTFAPVLTLGVPYQEEPPPVYTHAIDGAQIPVYEGLGAGYNQPGFWHTYVLDATLTGNRRLYGRAWNQSRIHAHEPSAHLRQIVDLWEVTIEGKPGDDLTITRTLIWSLNDLIDSETSTDTHPDGPPYRRVRSTAYWTYAGPGPNNSANLRSRYEWDVSAESDGSSDVSIFHFQLPHTRIITRSLTGRVVGAYYTPDGSIRRQTMDYTVRTVHSVSSEGPTQTSDIDATGNVAPGTGDTTYAWQRFLSQTSPCEYRVEGRTHSAIESVLEVRLRDGTLDVSRFIARETGTITRTYESAIVSMAGVESRNFDGGTAPIFDGWGGHGRSGSWSNKEARASTYRLDDYVVHSGESNRELNSPTWLGNSGYEVDWPSASAPYRAAELYPVLSSARAGIIVRPAAYNESMPVLRCTIGGGFVSGPLDVHYGAIALRGQRIPGRHSYIDLTLLSDIRLYAAHNAITGEWVRDTPTPCMYL